MKIVKALASVSAAALLVAPAFAQSSNVRIIHGINGGDLGAPESLNVDVYVNGGLLLDNFNFRDVAGPLSLPAGDYEVKVVLDLDMINGSADDTVVIGPAIIPIAAGTDNTIIAHLTEGGAPTASKFENDLMMMPGKSQLILHHTAAAPQVDIFARKTGGRTPFAMLAGGAPNGAQAMFKVSPSNWQLFVSPAGTMNPVLGPASFKFDNRTSYLVYVVGQITNTRNSLEPIIVRIGS